MVHYAFIVLLILLIIWAIATYINANGMIYYTQPARVPITYSKDEEKEDALTPYFPEVKPIVGDVPRTNVGGCVESKAPSTDLPIKNMPMTCIQRAPTMYLRPSM